MGVSAGGSVGMWEDVLTDLLPHSHTHSHTPHPLRTPLHGHSLTFIVIYFIVSTVKDEEENNSWVSR